MVLVGFLTPSAIFGVPLKSLLQTLNQPDPQASYPSSLDTNLTELYREELHQVKRAWEQQQPRGLSGKQLREKRNEFYEEQVQVMNAPAISWIESFGNTAKVSGEYQALAEKTLAEVAHHPKASVPHTLSLARGGDIGFCFGRALLIHHALLKAGVPQRDIVKVFALGDLRVEGQPWRFHVAVGVRDKENGLLILDPLQPRVLTAKNWLAETEKHDIKHPYSRTRFYATDPRKFLPAFGAYHTDQLTDPVLKSYFSDLAATL